MANPFNESVNKLVRAWEILGVTPSSTEQEIQRQHRDLMRKFYPRTGSSGRESDIAASINDARALALQALTPDTLNASDPSAARRQSDIADFKRQIVEAKKIFGDEDRKQARGVVDTEMKNRAATSQPMDPLERVKRIEEEIPKMAQYRRQALTRYQATTPPPKPQQPNAANTGGQRPGNQRSTPPNQRPATARPRPVSPVNQPPSGGNGGQQPPFSSTMRDPNGNTFNFHFHMNQGPAQPPQPPPQPQAPQQPPGQQFHYEPYRRPTAPPSTIFSEFRHCAEHIVGIGVGLASAGAVFGWLARNGSWHETAAMAAGIVGLAALGVSNQLVSAFVKPAQTDTGYIGHFFQGLAQKALPMALSFGLVASAVGWLDREVGPSSNVVVQGIHQVERVEAGAFRWVDSIIPGQKTPPLAFNNTYAPPTSLATSSDRQPTRVAMERKGSHPSYVPGAATA